MELFAYQPGPIEATSRGHLGPSTVLPHMDGGDEQQERSWEDRKDGILKDKRKVKDAIVAWTYRLVAGKPGLLLEGRVHVCRK